MAGRIQACVGLKKLRGSLTFILQINNAKLFNICYQGASFGWSELIVACSGNSSFWGPSCNRRIESRWSATECMKMTDRTKKASPVSPAEQRLPVSVSVGETEKCRLANCRFLHQCSACGASEHSSVKCPTKAVQWLGTVSSSDCGPAHACHCLLVWRLEMEAVCN